jgi:hypothetical protein
MGLLHGTFAFTAVGDFWRGERSSDDRRVDAEYEFARTRAQVAIGVEGLTNCHDLTDAGARVLETIRIRTSHWLNDEVDPRIGLLAESVVHEHRATWRIHHRSPDSAVVERLADEYVEESCALNDRRIISTYSRASNRSLALEVKEWLSTPSTAKMPLLPVDLRLLITDRGRTAATSWSQRIVFGEDAVACWVRLSVACHLLRASEPSALADRPELVRAVYRQLKRGNHGPATPIDLGAWLASRHDVRHLSS